MKPHVRGRSIDFREITEADAEFILHLRTNPLLNAHLSITPHDIEKQRTFIRNYFQSQTDYYFIIMDKAQNSIGSVRIYDIKDDSFCWGSWILSPDNKPKGAGIESALLLYDFAFYTLHYARSHFDVRKANQRVIDFHLRFGAVIAHEDELNFYFNYNQQQYAVTRATHLHYLPA
jgi:RimJ/RimL family protein N-acetyltransferase